MRTRSLQFCTLCIAVLVCVFLFYSHADAEGAIETQMIRPDESPWKSIDDLPPNIRAHVDALFAARDRTFTALDGKVESFSVDQVTIPEAVAKLSNDNNVLCGIELIPWQTKSTEIKSFALPKISLSVQDTTPRQILDKLTFLDPTFVWVEDQGIANVVIRSAYNCPLYPLNLTVDKFSVTDRPYSMVFFPALLNTIGLFELPQVSPALHIGHASKWPANLEPKVTFEMSGVSVRKIVNRVAQNVGMSWSLVWNDSPPPESWRSMAMFWMIPKVYIGLSESWIGASDKTVSMPK